MATQADIDTQTAAIVANTTALTKSTAQLAALGIAAPVNTDALVAAVTAQVTAVTANQAAVDAAAAKVNPTAQSGTAASPQSP